MSAIDPAQPDGTPQDGMASPRGAEFENGGQSRDAERSDSERQEAQSFDDTCGQIQVDLSAMLDGELEPDSVRRVVMHADSCATCRSFLDGIRAQARTHRVLQRVLTGADDDRVELHELAGAGSQVGTATGRGASITVLELRRQLTENRVQLARIFYELGRGFVLMGNQPSFSRVVAREPVPIPDMCRRGRNLVDEVERLAGASPSGAASSGASSSSASSSSASSSSASSSAPSSASSSSSPAGAEWAHAKAVFGDDLVQSAADNLRKGIGLLEDALMLAPDHDAARIYLGHALHVAGERERAEGVFREVLRVSTDASTRAFARMHLGNVYLEIGRPDRAELLFLELVQSGEIARRPDFFGLTYFNLALTSGMQGRFDDCRDWFSRLYAALPHKCRMIADELRARHEFVASLSSQPHVYDAFSTNFPFWFPKREAC